MFDSVIDKVVKSKVFYALILLFLVVWGLCKNMDIAFMLFASIIFSCALFPAVDRLSQKMSRTLAATAVLTGLILVIAIFIVPILILGAYQVTEFAIEFPKYIDTLDDTILSIPLLNNFSNLNIDTETFMNSVANSSSEIITYIINFIKSCSSAFIYIFTTIVFIFFMLTDKELIKKNYLMLFPSEIRKKVEQITDSITEKLGGYAVAQAVVSGSVWLTMTLGLLLFKIDYALILGLIAGVMSIIPVVGSALSLVICLIATYQAGWQAMLVVAIMFTISHFIENNVVRPYIYSKFLDLHPLIVFLALFVGGKYAGVVGIIFAPPFAMALCILLDELYTKKMN